MKKTGTCTFLAAVCLAFLLSGQTVWAAGFVQDTAGVKYQNDDGSFAADTWLQVGDSIYHVDADGLVQTGWIQVGSFWYFLDANGICTNSEGVTVPPADMTLPEAAVPAPAALQPAAAPALQPAAGNVQQPETAVTVWIPATGKKYHSINNCGRMNPAKAKQLSLEDALAKGYEKCSKCF